MASNPIKLTIHFTDPTLDAEERETAAQRLYGQLKDIDEVTVNRVAYTPPPDSKPVAATLIGLLTAEVSWKNFQQIMAFLGDRLSGKTIELEVEVGGRKLKVSASSREELEFAVKAAMDFVALETV